MICFSAVTNAQVKMIADYTIEMSAEIRDSANALTSTGIKTISVSSKKVRSDYSSARILQSTIRDNAAGSAVILRETIGDDSKYLRKLDADKWKKENIRFEELKYSITTESKKILNYDCKKATAQLKDGSLMIVWYTPAITVLSNENNFQFNAIPGLVLEYEIKNAQRSIHFTAASINFDPVPASKFAIPVSGYRIIE